MIGIEILDFSLAGQGNKGSSKSQLKLFLRSGRSGSRDGFGRRLRQGDLRRLPRSGSGVLFSVAEATSQSIVSEASGPRKPQPSVQTRQNV